MMLNTREVSTKMPEIYTFKLSKLMTNNGKSQVPHRNAQHIDLPWPNCMEGEVLPTPHLKLYIDLQVVHNSSLKLMRCSTCRQVS